MLWKIVSVLCTANKIGTKTSCFIFFFLKKSKRKKENENKKKKKILKWYTSRTIISKIATSF